MNLQATHLLMSLLQFMPLHTCNGTPDARFALAGSKRSGAASGSIAGLHDRPLTGSRWLALRPCEAARGWAATIAELPLSTRREFVPH